MSKNSKWLKRQQTQIGLANYEEILWLRNPAKLVLESSSENNYNIVHVLKEILNENSHTNNKIHIW